MDETFVGVHHLLQVERLVAVVGEGGIAVEVLIGLDNLIGIGLRRSGSLRTVPNFRDCNATLSKRVL